MEIGWSAISFRRVSYLERRVMSKSLYFYVVTRAGRRIEERNYVSLREAERRAETLRKMLKKWNDPDIFKVSVVGSETPHKIR